MKKLFTTLALLALTLHVVAIPAKRGIWRTITLADGTQVKAELRGDEHIHYWQTADKQCYVKEYNKETYRFISETEIDSIYTIRLAKANIHRAERRAKIGGDHVEYKGKKKGIIILTQFSDKKFAFGHNKSFYEEVANATTLSKGKEKLGFYGSVKQYFLEQSQGQFELDFDVVGPVTLDNPYKYYGENNGAPGNDKRAGKMVAQACQKAKEENKDIDWTQYDWDGNGYVDQVFVLYAGRGEASGGDENTIWPHEYQLTSSDYDSSLDMGNGIAINTYACGCELYQNVIGADRVDGVGTICHEFSHCLGLPDFYDTGNGGTNFGMGTWDLMDYGSYNGNSFCPAAYTAFERAYAGWLDPIELKEPTTVKGMRPISDGGQTFVIYNDANQNEYYLLENRQLVGWDSEQYGKGLLVTHVDYLEGPWTWNCVNSTVRGYYDGNNYVNNDHQRCTIIAADDDYSMESTGLAGDPYPGESGNKQLTNTSTPAATVFNKNTDGKLFMNKPITNIVQNADGTIDFDFMGGSSTHVIITGVKAIDAVADQSSKEYFDLQGRPVSSTARGLVIVRQGNKVTKVLK